MDIRHQNAFVKLDRAEHFNIRHFASAESLPAGGENFKQRKVELLRVHLVVFLLSFEVR